MCNRGLHREQQLSHSAAVTRAGAAGTMKQFLNKLRKFSRRSNSKLPLVSSLLHYKLRPGARLGREELLFLCSETGSSETEVRGKYKTFLASHPSGQISHEAFDELLAECFPAADLANIRDHIWRIYDVNMDGVIDFSEFLVALDIMSNGTPEQNLEQLFRFFDVNRNGYIDKREMELVVGDLMMLENNHNDEHIAQDVFSEMDENEDGDISLDEFVQACLCHKKSSSMLTMKVVNLFLDSMT